MLSLDVEKFMDGINTIMTFVNKSLNGTDIYNYVLEDAGNKIKFYVVRKNHNVLLNEVDKIAEDSLRVIYLSLKQKYGDRIEIGSTVTFTDSEILWNLAPVIGNNVLVEFVSNDSKDQEWFYKELDDSTKEKGLLESFFYTINSLLT